MMKLFKASQLMTVLVGFAVTAGASTTELPFTDKFDTMAVDEPVAGAWSTDWSGVAASTPTSPDGSARVLYSADSVRLNLDMDSIKEYTNVWWNSYVKVRPHAVGVMPDVGDSAAEFFVDANGALWAYSSNAWVTVTTGLTPSSWMGFSVQLDYSSQRWNIYKTEAGHTHGDALVKANTLPLVFNEAYTSNELSVVEVEGQTYLDAVMMTHASQSITPGVASPSNVASQGGTPLTLDDVLSGAVLDVFGGSGNMQGEFGNALKGLLTTGDKVAFYDSANTNFNIFTVDGNGNWDPADSFVVSPMRGMYIALNPAPAEPRQPAYVTAYSTKVDHTAADPEPVREGWNLLSLPFTAGTRSIEGATEDLNLPTPADGDQIYLRRNGEWIILRYMANLESPGWVRSGTTLAKETVPAGSGFWYRRRGAESTWNPGN